MCPLSRDFKLDLVCKALISCEHITHTQFCHKLLFRFLFTPLAALTHTLAIAASALLNILQHKALIRTLFSPSVERKHDPNWFCLPGLIGSSDDAALTNGNGFVRCSAGGDVNESRERCHNL